MRPKGRIEHYVIDDHAIDKAVAEIDVFAVIEPVWFSANIYDGKEAYEQSFLSFSDAQKLVHAIQWYTAEVINGGHEQFYSNGTGIVWQDALRGYLLFGLTEHADILRESAKRLGGSPSFSIEDRCAQLDTHDGDFEDLDSAFYAIKIKHEDAVLAYVDQHREEFYFDGKVLI